MTTLSLDVFSLEIISHRGNCCGGHENSLNAIDKAWASKVDAVEIDLRMSNDNMIFLFHDKNLKGRSVSTLTYSEIYKIDNNIPLLFSVLSSSLPSGYYIFDLKESNNDYLNAISDIINESDFPEKKIAFQSNHMSSLVTLREKHPTSKYVYLSNLKRSAPLFLATDPKELNKKLTKHNISNVSIQGRNFIKKEFIDILKKNNTKVFIWTINNIDRAVYYSKIGVDGVITDNVKGVRRAFKLIRPSSKGAAD